MRTVFLLIGLASWYGETHVGNPLYCDRGDGLIYSEGLPPWVAVDVNLYRSGRVQCGDRLLLSFADGKRLVARALDAGYLAEYGIVADVPMHLAPFDLARGVVPVRVMNASARMREEQ